MDEKIIKKYFGFLNDKYKMAYDCGSFDNYLGRAAAILTYSYYNEFGCFTIANVPVVGDVMYYRLKCVDHIPKFIVSGDYDTSQFKLDIFNYEPEIWEKHRKSGFLKIPFFWGSEKQVLRALAEVIETQIQKYGSFFGIKVK